jgi:hypothetical protein
MLDEKMARRSFLYARQAILYAEWYQPACYYVGHCIERVYYTWTHWYTSLSSDEIRGVGVCEILWEDCTALRNVNIGDLHTHLLDDISIERRALRNANIGDLHTHLLDDISIERCALRNVNIGDLHTTNLLDDISIEHRSHYDETGLCKRFGTVNFFLVIMMYGSQGMTLVCWMHPQKWSSTVGRKRDTLMGSYFDHDHDKQ